MTDMILSGVFETLYMTIVSTAAAYVIGLPLGIMLVITGRNGIKPMPAFNLVVGFIVNVFRSVPFLILMVAIIPFTRMVVGTAIGSTASIVPLTVAAAPFVARLVEASLAEVDAGVIEAAQSMGAGTWKIISKVMVPEARPSLLTNAALAIVTILGYSTMAGFVGGGGLGDLAITYGLYQFNSARMWEIVVIIVIIVQILQEAGLKIAKKSDNRIR